MGKDRGKNKKPFFRLGEKVKIQDDGEGFIIGSDPREKIYDVLRDDENGATVIESHTKDELEKEHGKD